MLARDIGSIGSYSMWKWNFVIPYIYLMLVEAYNVLLSEV